MTLLSAAISISACLLMVISHAVLSEDSVYVPGISHPTVLPETCKVYRQSTNCSDLSFRLACPDFCHIECPSPGFLYVGSRGLCYATTVQEKATWTHAQEYCRAYDARLAHLETEEDSQVLKYLQTQGGGSTQNRVLIGAVNFGVVDEWVWLDRSSFSAGGDFWSHDYPFFVPNGVECANIYVDDMYKKETHLCNQEMGFICEQSPNVAELVDEDGTEFI